jgi:hypothetical protein
MPWEALDANLEPAVLVSLLRSEHGPPFLACMTGTADPAAMMDLVGTWTSAELQDLEQHGWIRKGTWAHSDPEVRAASR